MVIVWENQLENEEAWEDDVGIVSYRRVVPEVTDKKCL
jgi:hypothetical protein